MRPHHSEKKASTRRADLLHSLSAEQERAAVQRVNTKITSMLASSFVSLLLVAAGQLAAGDRHPQMHGRVVGGYKAPPLGIIEEVYGAGAGSASIPRLAHKPLKRAGDPSPDDQDVGLAFNPSGCVFCPPNTAPGAMSGKDLLDFLTWQQMRTYQKGSDRDYKDTCVFYSAATSPPPDKLSGIATNWACSVRKYTIWHFWPNSLDAAAGMFGSRDFYAMFEPDDSWLAPIRKLPGLSAPPAHHEAQACLHPVFRGHVAGDGGAVHGRDHHNVAETFQSGRFLQVPHQPISGAALSTRPCCGGGDQITRMIVVDANSKRVWELDLLTLKVGKEISAGDLSGHTKRDLGNQTGSLHARADFCSSSGLNSEPAGMDWFGGDY